MALQLFKGSDFSKTDIEQGFEPAGANRSPPRECRL